MCEQRLRSFESSFGSEWSYARTKERPSLEVLWLTGKSVVLCANSCAMILE